ncbi:MAG: hypothetical protein JWM80_4019 [Cyanobacteria bacterium RYN_339]|nr:hypothetical protein [Cyanobacteria bacterium RYN_339]
MDKRHIINLQGRDYVTYEGLLDEAHRQGLRTIRTQVLQLPGAANEQTAVVMAEIEFDDKTGKRTFTGIGDASPRNVSRGILPHLIRMAETRAKARALRDGTNIGMTAFEELLEADLPREAGDDRSQATGPATDVTNINVKAAAKASGTKLATKAQIEAVSREMKRTGLTPEQGRDYLREHFNKISRSELNATEIELFLAYLKGLPEAASA